MTQPQRTAAVPGDDEKRSLGWAHTARFLTTASRLDQLPAGELPEIAFVGRSNAGKSTAINALTQQRRLAFASKTPGRTQHINLFEVGPREAPDALFADLPGYGYAAVARGAKERWQEVMAEYLAVRRSLAGVVLLTKADKLNRREAQTALRTAQDALGAYATDAADIGVTLFSALGRQGIGDAAVNLHQWVHP